MSFVQLSVKKNYIYLGIYYFLLTDVPCYLRVPRLLFVMVDKNTLSALYW